MATRLIGGGIIFLTQIVIPLKQRFLIMQHGNETLILSFRLHSTMLLCLVASGAFASDPEADIFVGEVSLVLGKAYIEGPDRSRHTVEVGSPVETNGA